MVVSWFRHALFDNGIYQQKHVNYGIIDYGLLYAIYEEWTGATSSFHLLTGKIKMILNHLSCMPSSHRGLSPGP